ncbi:MAG: ATPase [Prevotellaceae bacterium]|jgi:AAA+ ATPase superfamily predicted ATPase|nr:ATPase [Prevotellaceae bacterium]
MNNPFVITGHIPDKYFCDRREETARVVRELSNNGNLCLISPRRMGKSKLVHHCYNHPEFAGRYYTFYVDILHTSGLREFTYIFGQQIFETLHTTNRKMLVAFVQGLKSINAKFGFDALTNMPTFSLELGDISRPEFTLTEIFRCLEQADKPCIVTFDEFQQITKYPEKNIEALLRAHIQNLSNVHFVFAGSERHLVTEMFLSSARPFYNSTSIMELHPIAPAEYIPFVCHCFKEYERSIHEVEVQKIYTLFEGNTYYMQKTFHEAFINTPIGEVCTSDIVRQTIDEILEEAGDGYRQLLSRIPERQKELLYAIAIEEKAQKLMSAGFIRQHSLASSSAVQAAVRKLMELDLLIVEDSVYYIPDILFRMYLQRLRNKDVTFVR